MPLFYKGFLAGPCFCLLGNTCTAHVSECELSGVEGVSFSVPQDAQLQRLPQHGALPALKIVQSTELSQNSWRGIVTGGACDINPWRQGSLTHECSGDSHWHFPRVPALSRVSMGLQVAGLEACFGAEEEVAMPALDLQDRSRAWGLTHLFSTMRRAVVKLWLKVEDS